jgi:hypothetical protein
MVQLTPGQEGTGRRRESARVAADRLAVLDRQMSGDSDFVGVGRLQGSARRGFMKPDPPTRWSRSCASSATASRSTGPTVSP